MIVTPNEYRDGIIVLCSRRCDYGNWTIDKGTSLHHFRDPLLDVVSSDEDLDLMGIMIVGTPDDNTDKLLVGTVRQCGQKPCAQMEPFFQRMGGATVMWTLQIWQSRWKSGNPGHRAEIQRYGWTVRSKRMNIWVEFWNINKSEEGVEDGMCSAKIM